VREGEDYSEKKRASYSQRRSPCGGGKSLPLSLGGREESFEPKKELAKEKDRGSALPHQGKSRLIPKRGGRYEKEGKDWTLDQRDYHLSNTPLLKSTRGK